VEKMNNSLLKNQILNNRRNRYMTCQVAYELASLFVIE